MTQNTENMKAVIIAGGNGTRLWPKSRKEQPKQFQALASERTMLQETYDRLAATFAPEDIYIATNEIYVDVIKEQTPDVPVKNIIAETAQRDTASAVALICGVVAHDDPEAIVAVFPSDHVIQDSTQLIAGVESAHTFITENPEYILTFGIAPTQPEIGYGYIKKAQALSGEGDQTVYRAEKFVEKPDHDTAVSYLDDGNYYWNAGMFVFNVREMIAKYAAYVPDTHKRLETIMAAMGTPSYSDVLRAEYAEMDKVSVDYAIMENAQDVAIIPLELAWSDVGNWVALKETLIADKDAHLSQGEHIDFKSKNTIVFGDKKPVVTVGLEDLIIIDTEKALLVCSHAEAANLSTYVKEMGAGDYEHLL